MRARARRIPILVTVAVGLALAGAPPVLAETNVPARFPAAGELVCAVAVRAEPGRSSRVVKRLRRFRPDHQFQIVLALPARRGRDKAWWYRLSLPGASERSPRLGQGRRRRGAAGREPDRRPAWGTTDRCPSHPRRQAHASEHRPPGAYGSETPRAATSTSSRRSCRRTRSSGRSRSRRARLPASPTGRRTSSGSTARPAGIARAGGFARLHSRRHVSSRGSAGSRPSGRRSPSSRSSARDDGVPAPGPRGGFGTAWWAATARAPPDECTKPIPLRAGRSPHDPGAAGRQPAGAHPGRRRAPATPASGLPTVPRREARPPKTARSGAPSARRSGSAGAEAGGARRPTTWAIAAATLLR